MKKFISKLFSRLQLKKNNSEPINLEERLNELAYFTNLVKNGMTVYLGDYTALTRIFTGQKMYVDTRDVSNAPHLMLEGYWEMQITEVIRKFIKSDTIFFDVGAHVGYFSIIAGTQIKTGQIHAFEANPELTPLIEKSRSVNGLDQIMTVNNVAISDKKGVLKLSRYADLWGSSTVHETQDKRIDKTYAVEAISLDDYLESNKITHVDMIKMDIEGYEDKAYEGMTKLVKSSPDLLIFMEYSDATYKSSAVFFEKLQHDFAYIYAIEDSGTLTRIHSYEILHERSQKDWAMIVLAHRELQ